MMSSEATARRLKPPKLESLNRSELMQVYLAVESRRESMNTLLWQVPALSLTAQAFLFSVSADRATSPTGRLLTSLAGLLIMLATVQLFMRHRRMEVRASKWLEQLEIAMRLPVVHAHPLFEGQLIRGVGALEPNSKRALKPSDDDEDKRVGLVARLRPRHAYHVWTALLMLLAAINLAVTVMAILELAGVSSPLSS